MFFACTTLPQGWYSLKPCLKSYVKTRFLRLNLVLTINAPKVLKFARESKVALYSSKKQTILKQALMVEKINFPSEYLLIKDMQLISRVHRFS